MTKQDNLSPAHLEWLVQSRSRCQVAGLELFKLFEEHASKAKSKTYNRIFQTFVSVNFSLWRAAFLADKT